MLKDTLLLLNPWWKEEKVSKELAKPYKRKVFIKLLEVIKPKYRQIAIISGLRRVGKTTLMYQLIELLLKKTETRKIIYFNFDKEIDEIEKVLKEYAEITGINWKKEKIYIFLDEIVKLENWARKIKLLYDAFPNLKFIVSSSSSIGLEEEAIKNLAGRYFLINVKPLSFIEFLEMKKKDKYLTNIKLYENELRKEFKQYLLRTFPDIVDWQSKELIKDYLKTTIIDKIVKIDLTEKFRNVDRELLFKLIEIFYSNSGMIVNYDEISKSLRISKKTLLKHIWLLEFSYLIRKVFNFRPSVMARTRKLQKIYSYWWNLLYCYNENNDKIAENFVVSLIDGKYYWRESNKEINFLKVNKKITPIEVKNKINLSKRDFESMKYFVKKFNVKEGKIVYDGEEKEIKIERRKIELIPFWKFSLIA